MASSELTLWSRVLIFNLAQGLPPQFTRLLNIRLHLIFFESPIDWQTVCGEDQAHTSNQGIFL